MPALDLSVVIPSRDRPAKVQQTLAALMRQSLGPDAYEIVLVDDGSEPPLAPGPFDGGAPLRVLRLRGGGRSAARNAGVDEARGRLLVFVDDDISVAPEFLERHLRAQDEWPGAMVVGGLVLSEDGTETPFAAFRRQLEATGVPVQRGLVSARVCAAGNLSMARARFKELGGFDEQLASGEDQDLAFRHTQRGGAVAFVPEALGVHRDDARDIRSYCRRVEQGSVSLVALCRKNPDWPENAERDRVNGPWRPGRESLREGLKKLAKRVLATPPLTAALLAATSVLERSAPTAVVHAAYRWLIGLYLFRGYRRGLLAPEERRG